MGDGRICDEGDICDPIPIGLGYGTASEAEHTARQLIRGLIAKEGSTSTASGNVAS
jgi:hypothetical protein